MRKRENVKSMSGYSKAVVLVAQRLRKTNSIQYLIHNRPMYYKSMSEKSDEQNPI